MIRAVQVTLLTLTVFGLMIRALVPLGFMPDLSGTTTALVICSGNSTQTIYLDEDGKPAKGNHQAEAPCTYTFTPLAFAPLHPQMADVLPVHAAAAYMPQGDRPQPSSPRRAHKPRGPPSISI